MKRGLEPSRGAWRGPNGWGSAGAAVGVAETIQVSGYPEAANVQAADCIV